MTIKKTAVPHRYRNKYLREGSQTTAVATASGGEGGGIQSESDPVFSASPAAQLTEEMISILEQMHMEEDETISVDLGFFSRSFLSAYGSNSGGGGGGGGGIGVSITGTGNAVINAVYDSANALLRLTKGDVQAVISDLATIRSNAANGNTAYGWGNHASAGYWVWNVDDIKAVKVNNAEKAESATTADSCTGNAATATGLATARTLWGQSFNGTANVSGDIRNTGSVTPSADGSKYIGSTSLHYAGIYVNALRGNCDNLYLTNQKAGGTVEIWTRPSGTTNNQKVVEFRADKSSVFEGNILSKGAITAYTTSDERLKENIREADCLSLIKSLGGVKQFDYRETGKHSIGLIAQNLEDTELRDAVYEREDGYKAVNYLDPRMVSIALGACDQLRRENEELKGRVERLEKMVEQLITDKI